MSILYVCDYCAPMRGLQPPAIYEVASITTMTSLMYYKHDDYIRFNVKENRLTNRNSTKENLNKCNISQRTENTKT